MPKFERTAIKIAGHSPDGDVRSGRSRWMKLGFGLVLIAAGVLVARHFGVFEILTVENIDRVRTWFDSLGWWAPLVFILLWIATCIFFLPGLPVSIAGGLIFGAVWGTVWTTVGANLGATAAFLIGRYAARGMVLRIVAKNDALRRIDDGVRRHGWRMLLITRLVPAFPFSIQNYVYGLTDIPLRTYVLVTLPSMLPATVAFNFAAGSVRTGSFGTTLWYLGIAAVFFVMASLLPSWVRARFGEIVTDR